MHWRRKRQPTPVFLPGESQGRGSPVYGVAQSCTQLKRFSCSSLTAAAGSCLVTKLCLILLRSHGLGPSVHGIFQIRILECVAISSSRATSQPRNRTLVSCTGRWILTADPLGKLTETVRVCQLSAERRDVLLLLVTYRHCVGMGPKKNLGR